MTDKEAKTKWCPFSRIVRQDGDERKFLNTGPFNRLSLENPPESAQTMCEDENCSCIGSQCMAWRWAEQKMSFSYVIDIIDDLEKGDSIIANAIKNSECKGYCGLAGKP